MENNINYAALSLDDIIFLGRNKDYGAYDLRRSYDQNVKRAVLCTIFFAVFAILCQTLYAHYHPHVTDTTITTVIDLSTIVQPKPPVQPIVQRREELKQGKPDAASSVMAEKKPTRDDQVPSDSLIPIDPNTEISDHATAGISGVASGTETGTAPTEVPKADPPADNSVHDFVETMPMYPGGESALLGFIRDHTRFPDYENEAGIQGKAIVGFVIDERGKVTNVHIIRGVSAGIDREAMRVVRLLHDFTPGVQSGRNVKVSYIVPISFQQIRE